MIRGVFLDRDGTLIEEKNYLHRPEDVEFYPGAFAALRRLQQAGFLLIIVTNQSGVGRGYFTLQDVDLVHQRMIADCSREGVTLTQFYIAPEAPDQPSRVRKPSPQFLLDARDQFKVDLASSFMIGDKLIDLECGWNAGVHKSILVRTGYGREVERSAGEKLRDAFVAEGLSQAADYILG